MSAELRQVIDQLLIEHFLINQRFGIETNLLFPSPTNPSKPVSKDLAADWLKRAEKLANVPKQNGSLWHAYRRKWVSERKHLSDTDVAAVGGWSDTRTLKECYAQRDPDTMMAVVEGRKDIRNRD